MFALQEGLSSPLELPGVTVSGVAVAFDFAKFELTLDLRPTRTEVRGSLEYNADLLDRQTAERFADGILGETVSEAFFTIPIVLLPTLRLAVPTSGDREPHQPSRRRLSPRTRCPPGRAS